MVFNSKINNELVNINKPKLTLEHKKLMINNLFLINRIKL